ncbi:alpha/beta hydrolase [Bdellovibrio sp. HCB2-146]|uniref:alpha/beta hydrolase n=1 Tax=Bdellovibrio sp. HCB2-146 TaxID=3394362 RepID=UPI0039BC93AD
MKEESTLEYIYIPAKEKTGEKSPVLIALHGVGSNEKDLANFAASLNPKLAVISLRAPLKLGIESFAWFHVRFTSEGPNHNRAEAEESRLAIRKFIASLKDHLEIDSSKIFLLGFSQGTIMSLSLALTEPELVKGVIGIGGRTLQEISAQARERSYHVSPKVLLIHGKNDNKLPYFHAEASAETLKQAKFDYELKSYDAGHEITTEMAEDIRAWLVQNI